LNLIDQPASLCFVYSFTITKQKNFFIKQIDSSILCGNEPILLRNLIEFDTNSFKLLWRGSRDGFQAISFHQHCDNIKNTLVLVKSTNKAIFGGYTTVPWTSPEGDRTEADNSAFLFSLINKNKLPKIFRVKQNNFQETQVLQDAVCHCPGDGPGFGLHYSGRDHLDRIEYRHDLLIKDRSNEVESSHIELRQYENLDNIPSSYIHGGVGIYFKAEEVEIFEIV
jgi:hypothetical protein